MISSDKQIAPDDVILAGRKLKAVRFLYSGYAALAMASFVLSWNKAPTSLWSIAASIVALTLIIAIAVNIVGHLNVTTALVAQITLLVFAIVMLALFISSAFFGCPERGSIFVASLLHSEELAIQRSDLRGEIILPSDTAAWPEWTRERPGEGDDRFATIAALSKLPPLTLTGTQLHASGRYYFNTLFLDGSTILTDGQDVTIEAVRIKGNNATVRAFEERPESGSGRSAGRLTLIVYQRLDGELTVNLSGEKGAVGSPGSDGQKGAAGAPGGNSSSNLFDCRRGGGRGEKGRDGFPGEDGGPGGVGGDGGTLIVQAASASVILNSINFIRNGGSGGTGGPGGRGGAGGAGGPGGKGGGYCNGGEDGGPGEFGSSGHRGTDGQPGRTGSIITLSFKQGLPR